MKCARSLAILELFDAHAAITGCDHVELSGDCSPTADLFSGVVRYA